MRTRLSHQAVYERSPVGNGPALGLSIIRVDVAADQRFAWQGTFYAFLAQQLLHLEVRSLINIKSGNAICRCKSCSGGPCQFQAVVNLVFVIKRSPVPPTSRNTARETIGHKAGEALWSIAYAPPGST